MVLGCRKIAVIGGESTGKSTLCADLALKFQTFWVPEYARAYLETLGRPYKESDLLLIAKGQLQHEDHYDSLASRFLFCDTNLMVIKVWSEYAYGQVHPDIEELHRQRHYDAYLIAAPDFPWQPDPLREHPEEHLRHFFFRRYVDLVGESGTPYCIVQGSETNRLQKSVHFLESIFLP